MNNKKIKIKKIILLFALFLLMFLSYSFWWAKRNYANIALAQIVFTLNMTMKGTAGDILKSYFLTAFVPSIIFTVVAWIGMLILIKKHYYLEITLGQKSFCLKLKKCIFIIIYGYWFIFLILAADCQFAIFDFCKNQMQQSNFIEEEYVAPESVKIIFPEQKRNLINIYIESGETSFQNINNGGMCEVNYMPEMTKLAKDNISFSHTDLLEGATVAPACGWTIAGLVAETAGIPLKLFGYDELNVDNSMERFNSFLPGVTTIGDLLEKEGYKNFFMAGSEFEFGGRKSYYSTHGNYEIWDYNTAKEKDKIADDYKVFWGFEDKKLYQFAKEELLQLAENEQPFNFSLLTVDTHQPQGYLCDLCENKYDEQYANVWACASKQLNEFINWIQEQEFYENTTIVILGDHCSMSTGIIESEYQKHTGETNRKVYNTFINSVATPVNEKNRKFTTMDMFPSVLASIGVEIEGNKLALGTNLFSDKSTLAEEYGYEVLFEELNKKSLFYDRELLYPQKTGK